MESVSSSTLVISPVGQINSGPYPVPTKGGNSGQIPLDIVIDYWYEELRSCKHLTMYLTDLLTTMTDSSDRVKLSSMVSGLG